MNPVVTPDIIDQLVSAPWYQSTQGPQVSGTLISLAGLIVPVIQDTFHISVGIPWVNTLINVACILGFGGYGLYRATVARKTLQNALGSLTSQVKKLGAVPGE